LSSTQNKLALGAMSNSAHERAAEIIGRGCGWMRVCSQTAGQSGLSAAWPASVQFTHAREEGGENATVQASGHAGQGQQLRTLAVHRPANVAQVKSAQAG
jgi:hypothetical protein